MFIGVNGRETTPVLYTNTQSSNPGYNAEERANLHFHSQHLQK